MTVPDTPQPPEPTRWDDGGVMSQRPLLDDDDTPQPPAHWTADNDLDLRWDEDVDLLRVVEGARRGHEWALEAFAALVADVEAARNPTKHPNFRETAEWLTVPGRTFLLDGVVYKVVEDDPEAEAARDALAATLTRARALVDALHGAEVWLDFLRTLHDLAALLSDTPDPDPETTP